MSAPDSRTDAAPDAEHIETTRERFHRTLVRRAAEIKTVRNDVFTMPVPLLVLNFALGIATVALLIVSMLRDGTVGNACLIAGIVLLAVTIVYNIVLRAKLPMSILQYTARSDGKEYCFRIISKSRAAFSDGEKTVEVHNNAYELTSDPSFAQYRFDFFADMDADMRIASADKETFKGTVEHNGKTLKCSITFKNGVAAYGNVGGVRIKYFDVNNTQEKFVVPRVLRDAAKKAGMDFPKLAGVQVNENA